MAGTGVPLRGALAVNLLGSFLIGLIQEVGTTASLLIPDTTRLFLTIGVMGGLTTYSTFSYETVRLARHQEDTAHARDRR